MIRLYKITLSYANCILQKLIQSNLCTTATLGTPKYRRWWLFRGWSKILDKFIVGLLGLGIQASCCWPVVIVQRWPLAQVWLYVIIEDKEVKVTFSKRAIFEGTCFFIENNTQRNNLKILKKYYLIKRPILLETVIIYFIFYLT